MIDLRLGDCLEILPTLADNSVDAVITDPPYGIGKDVWDEEDWELIRLSAEECSRILKPDGICFWFCSIEHLPKAIEATSAIPYKWQFIWYASNNMQRGKVGYCKYTSVLVLSHNGVWRGMQDLRNIPIPSKKKADLYHPTEKPLALMEYLVGKSCKEGVVLDPFFGSCTTGVACVQTGRNFIGIEIEEKYYKIAEKRIAEAQLQIRMEI